MGRCLSVALGVLAGMMQSVAVAQGVLMINNRPSILPRPGLSHVRPSIAPVVSSYKIKELAVQARISDQVARVQVSQSFVNTGNVQMEVQFLFPLPYDGAIDQLTLLVDGKEFPGKLLPAHDARSIYESIVRTNRDPALLEWMGMGLFQTSVFPVPPGATRTVTLHYNQLLRQNHELTDFLFPLSAAKYTSQPPEKIEIQLAIESAVDIKNVYSPTHSVEIKRPDAKHVVVSYVRTHETPAGDFRLLFDTNQRQVGANVISYKPAANEDGFFLLLASPEVKAIDAERPKKTVIFVVDRSGSMSGTKFEQARSALKFVLNNLREGDLFNIIAYETSVESFRPELELFNETTRKAALGFVEGLRPGGGTNIHRSLTMALDQLQDNKRPSYVLFLTDGLPTVGVRDENQICAAAKASNKAHARILSLGVGYDVNSRLLDRISRDGFGLSAYVRPNEDIETHVSSLYASISSPVLTDATINMELEGLKIEDGPAINRTYPQNKFDLFEGQQLVIVGRYHKSGTAKLTLKGRVDGYDQTFEFPVKLIEKSNDDNCAFVEKLWAMRRIGEIIDQIDLSGKNDELVKELVELSTRHGILTPYTSFLADDSVRPTLTNAEGIERANRSLQRLSESSGRSGVSQRASKGYFQNAENTYDISKAKSASQKSAPMMAGGNSPALNSFRGIDSDEDIAADSVRQLGNQAVYLRRLPGKQERILVTPETANLDLEKDKDQFQVVERFTDPYFSLVKANSPTENLILSQQSGDEQLLIKLRGQVYLVR
jgi:Ca-activated chloride channel homolog